METVIKVLGIQCQLTGTDDYGTYDPDLPQCFGCTYKKMCSAKFDAEELERAREIWLDGQKMMAEAQMLIDTAKRIFEQQAEHNKIVHYQYGQIVFNRVYIKEQITYPKAKLEKTFTPEQLASCAETRPASWQTRITDLLKEKTNDAK